MSSHELWLQDSNTKEYTFNVDLENKESIEDVYNELYFAMTEYIEKTENERAKRYFLKIRDEQLCIDSTVDELIFLAEICNRLQKSGLLDSM